MGKIVIVDDNLYFAEILKGKVLEYVDEEIYTFDRFDLEYFKNNDVDLLLLDIELNGANGIDEATKLRKIDEEIKIAFVTSHRELVYDVFKTGPVYFVNKDNLDSDLMWMFIELKRRGFRNNKILTTKTLQINMDSIVFIESLKHNIVFHLMDNYQLKERNKLDELVLNDYVFIRIHKSFIVNAKYIKKVERQSIYLTNGCKLKISRKYLKKFNINYSRYLLYK